MDKLHLVQILKKYYLNGLVEKASLVVKDKKISIKVVSPNKDLVGYVDADIELQDCDLGIYDTSQLLKLIGITGSFLTLNLDMKHKIAKTLLIADNEYNLEYALADTMMIPSVPTIEEPEYDVSMDVDAEFIEKFIKSAKALDTEIFTIESLVDDKGVNLVKIILGGQEKHTNKVHFTSIAQNVGTPGEVLRFPISEFREILDTNKDMVSGVLQLSEQGFMRIDFKSENITNYYFLVAKE